MAIKSVVAQGPNGARMMRGDGPPTAATGRTYAVGDTIFNDAQSSAEPRSWVCVVAGDPGTWEAQGASLEEITVGPLAAANVSLAIPVKFPIRAIRGVGARYTVAGGSGASLDVEKLTGTTAPGSGTTQLTAAIALTGTANTNLNGTVIASPAAFAVGDSIGLVLAGTLTGLVNLMATIVVERA